MITVLNLAVLVSTGFAAMLRSLSKSLEGAGDSIVSLVSSVACHPTHYCVWEWAVESYCCLLVDVACT